MDETRDACLHKTVIRVRRLKITTLTFSAGFCQNRKEEENQSPYGLELNQEAVVFLTANVFVKPIANTMLKTKIYLELKIIISKKGWTTHNLT